MAAALLMPRETLQWSVPDAFGYIGHKGDYAYVDGDCAICFESMRTVGSYIAKTYAVSMKLAQIRLEQIGYFRREKKEALVF